MSYRQPLHHYRYDSGTRLSPFQVRRWRHRRRLPRGGIVDGRLLAIVYEERHDGHVTRLLIIAVVDADVHQ